MFATAGSEFCKRACFFAGLLLAALLGFPGAFAGESSADKKLVEDIDGVLDKQCDAWNAGDLDGFMSVYENSDALSFSSGGKTIWGYKALSERYRQKYGQKTDSMGTLHFPELKIVSLSKAHDAALAIGRWHLDRSQGSIGGVFSLVLKKQGKDWKIVHDHTSPSPENPKD